MTQEELNQLVELHEAWLINSEDGEQANLVLVDLDGLELYNANLTRSSFCGVSFKGCRIDKCVFDDSHLVECDFTEAFITDTRFDGSVMFNSVFVDSSLLSCSFYATDLNSSIFEKCNVQSISMQAASLGNVSFFNVNTEALLFDDLLEAPPTDE